MSVSPASSTVAPVYSVISPQAGRAAVTVSQPGSSGSLAAISPSIVDAAGRGLTVPNGRIATAGDIQNGVDGINRQIENINQTDWAKLGFSPAQIAATKQAAQRIFQAAEGGAISFAGQQGISGIKFDFEKVDVSAESSVQPPPLAKPLATQPTLEARLPAPPVNSSPASSADIALALLGESSSPINFTV